MAVIPVGTTLWPSPNLMRCVLFLSSALRYTHRIATKPAQYLTSHEKMTHGFVNTNAELTVTGKQIDPLSLRSVNALTTTVHYCSTRVGGVCGGPCTVYTGGGTCLNAPDTNCLNATNNVAFCDRAGCSSNCRQLSTCATPMDSGFCFTPDTESILVFFAK